MFKKIFLILFLVLAISITPVFADGVEENQSKKYDFMFTLSGGNIGGQFTLTGDFLYAQEFGVGFFQAAGFANLNGNTKEYGGSLGLGANSDEGFSFYLFADSLYSYEKFWIQLRPTVRLRFSWLGLTGFYAYPLTESTIQVGDEEVGAAKYFGGEVEIVPVNWARIYGSTIFVEQSYKKYRVGAEVRLLKWVSLSADWNKADSGLYSQWTNYKDFRVALNVLFGAQQQSFKPTHRKIIPVFYPILVAKEEEPEPEPNYGEVEILYERDPNREILNPHASEPTGGRGSITTPTGGGGNTSPWEQVGENQWKATALLEFSSKSRYIWLYDPKIEVVYGECIGWKISMRPSGGNGEWVVLTRVVDHVLGGKGKCAEFVWNKGRIQIPSY